jgi:hypothetical protein
MSRVEKLRRMEAESLDEYLDLVTVFGQSNMPHDEARLKDARAQWKRLEEARKLAESDAKAS